MRTPRTIIATAFTAGPSFRTATSSPHPATTATEFTTSSAASIRFHGRTTPTSPSPAGNAIPAIEKAYRASIHGTALAAGNVKAPVCTDCHTAHQIELPKTTHFKAQSDQMCGNCHQDRLANYRDTYHGKAMALARPGERADVKVAACYDCHGAHNVFPPSDPRSLLSAGHIVNTCQQCHPGVGVKFTEYRPHADPLDKVHYPLFHYVLFGMTGLLLGVFGFFGVHTGLWLWRSSRLYLQDSKGFREAAARTRADQQTIVRFTGYQRILHTMVVISFLLLVLTGMPSSSTTPPGREKFSPSWAASTTPANFTAWGPSSPSAISPCTSSRSRSNYGSGVAPSAIRRPGDTSLRLMVGAIFGPDSLVPSWQDVRDFTAQVKWFIGRGPRPQFDRWTYWEKFDYMAVFWGVFMIGVSGLIMWFPKFFSMFLPGWMINVSLLIHSDEALLAAGFIFTVHFFNTHFRVERFPMDTVIFSGSISRTELMHERRKWYDRLVAAGRLDLRGMPAQWRKHRTMGEDVRFSRAGHPRPGHLLALIIYAMLSRLLG